MIATNMIRPLCNASLIDDELVVALMMKVSKGVVHTEASALLRI
jgi:hypothetical protein